MQGDVQSPPVGDGVLLEVRGLKRHFPVGDHLFKRSRHVKAVDGVDLTIRSGETLGLVGESGCGKTTLGRLIARLDEPTEGSILFEGRTISGLGDSALRPIRRSIQIIFQNPFSSLNPRMTVGDILEEPLIIHRTDDRDGRRRRVMQLLDMVGLGREYANRYPHEFSGGQRQRIGIARAIALNPKLIVCDEPVSALDVSIQAQIINLLAALQREFGLALIFISHNLAIVRHISHRVLVLYLGRAVEIAPRERLFGGPRHPYTQALLEAAPTPDPRREKAKPRLAIAGDPPSPLDPPSGCAFRTRCPKASDLCARVRPELLDDGGDPAWRVACHHWRE